jgi:aminopeptidase N
MKKLALLALLSLLSVTAFAARLPVNVIPSHYAITITTDLAKETFDGDVTIDVDVKEPVSTITMHGVGFTYHEATITAGGQTTTANVSEAGNEMITLKPAAQIPAGPAKIHIVFDAPLSKQLRGLYLSTTPARKYAVTQFEPTDARRAFPSFDEPAMKATFDIALVVDKGDTAISNAPIASDTPAGDTKHRIQFATTSRMSTYLVAMLVGDFQCVSGSADATPIRVCAPAGQQQMGAWALESATAVVKFYNDYFGIKYPFAKLDLISIPDFEAGAMENAGAITFRDTALLIDPKTASIGQKKGVSATVAHEIAHQWFGDLVTMKWWDDIWLNEGFATFMTAKPLESWHPEWNTTLDSVAGSGQSLALDSQRATRPIRTPAETRDEINQLFDGIAYGKTAAVLRMVEGWLGRDTFRDGIRAYLKKYSFSNAAAEDFWGTMAATSKKPVDAVMKSFVDQPGAPLIHASDVCKDTSHDVTVQQERLTQKGQEVAEVWSIPVCPKGMGCAVLSDAAAHLNVPNCNKSIFLNANGRGYFVTDYSDAERKALFARLTDLNSAERIMLRSNEGLLVSLLRRDVGDYLAMLQATPKPADRTLVEGIVGSLYQLDRQLVTDANRAAWQRTVRSILTGLAPATWTAPQGETDEARQSRAAVLFALGRLGADPQVIAGARDIANKFLSDPASVDRTDAQAALAIAAANGDAALFDRLVSAYEQATIPALKETYLGVLTDFSDPALIQRALDYGFSAKLKSQDLPSYMAQLSFNPFARTVAWSAIKAHWADLQRDVPTAMGAFVAGVGTFCDPAAKKDVQDFFATHPAGTASRSLQRSLESLDRCMAFRAAQQASFDKATASMK